MFSPERMKAGHTLVCDQGEQAVSAHVLVLESQTDKTEGTERIECLWSETVCCDVLVTILSHELRMQCPYS